MKANVSIMKIVFFSPFLGVNFVFHFFRSMDKIRKEKHRTLPKFNIASEKWWLEDYFPISTEGHQSAVFKANFMQFSKLI